MPTNPAKTTNVLITCEHGGNTIPPEYKVHFREHAELLSSHRGYDPGALDLAWDFARRLPSKMISSKVSRLLVDLNRSEGHPHHFSIITRTWSQADRQKLIDRHYTPYRHLVEGTIRRRVDAGERVVHVSVHSFTPVLNGRPRRGDVGFLYDPSRRGEVEFVKRWMEGVQSRQPGLLLRRNYPYRGVSDGLTTYLRGHWGDRVYAGIELEVNQSFPLGPAAAWRELRRNLVAALAGVLEGH